MGKTDNLGSLVKKLTHTMALELDRRLKVHNITIAQWAVLRQLWEREGRSQVELQEHISLEAATISALIQRMLRAGLVQRRPDPVDKRVQRVFLTEQGRALEQTVQQLVEEVHVRALAGFTDDEHAFLLRLLTRALHNFDDA